MRLVTVAAFGAGYLIGARAGRQRYDTLLALARRAGASVDGSTVGRRLEAASDRLESYATEHRARQAVGPNGRVRTGG